MPTGHFEGHILPSSLEITIAEPTRITIPTSDERPTVEFTIAVLYGKIDIECVTSSFQDEDLGFLYARAYDLARACLDVVTFGSGQGMTLILDTFTKPDGSIVPLGHANFDLAKECTVYDAKAAFGQSRLEFGAVRRVVMREPALFLLLNDLTQNLILPHQAPTSCGRVLDGLRKLIAPNLDAKKGWLQMQQALNVDKDYLGWVSNQSLNPRHGDKSFISSPIILEVLRRTWAVMNRFIAFRKGGNQPLSITEFPTLSASSDPS